MLINCDFGKEEQVIEQLCTLSVVKEAQAINGVYDIIAKLESETKKELDYTIKSEILKINPVNSVLTLESEYSFKVNNCEQMQSGVYSMMEIDDKQEYSKGKCWFCQTSCDPKSNVHEDCVIIMSELYRSQAER